MKTHKDLELWKNSMELVTDVYEITKDFPKNEQYGLISQIRRSAISVPSNIAESAGRNHNKEFIQFLYIALGSLSELETQFIISCNLKFISITTLENLNQKMKVIKNQVNGLIKYLNDRK